MRCLVRFVWIKRLVNTPTKRALVEFVRVKLFVAYVFQQTSAHSKVVRVSKRVTVSVQE
jgi:hypothetical protein